MPDITRSSRRRPRKPDARDYLFNRGWRLWFAPTKEGEWTWEKDGKVLTEEKAVKVQKEVDARIGRG